MKQKTTLITAGFFGNLAVDIGAFGAHALKDLLLANGRQDTFELAVRYQFYHTLALLFVGILMEKYPSLKTAALFFTIGIILFSGSLYFLALANQPMWGAVTPIGGLGFIAGWLSFLWAVVKSKTN